MKKKDQKITFYSVYSLLTKWSLSIKLKRNECQNYLPHLFVPSKFHYHIWGFGLVLVINFLRDNLLPSVQFAPKMNLSCDPGRTVHHWEAEHASVMNQIPAETDDQMTRRVSVQTPSLEVKVVFLYTSIQTRSLTIHFSHRVVYLVRGNFVLRFRSVFMCTKMALSLGSPEDHD